MRQESSSSGDAGVHVNGSGTVSYDPTRNMMVTLSQVAHVPLTIITTTPIAAAVAAMMFL